MKEILDSILFRNLGDGIHGQTHAKHVYALAHMLAKKLGNVDTQAIMIASLLHDCGRQNDYDDPLHAERSANYVETYIDYTAIACDKERIREIILHHCPPPGYDTPPSTEAMIVGDADKLDRYRFHYGSPCDPMLLELEESKALMPVAARMNNHPDAPR